MRQFIEAIEATSGEKLVEDHQGVVLRRETFGMGLETLYGETFALTGGWRTGSAPAGLMRCGYAIIDMEAMRRGANQQQATLGRIEVYKDADGIVGLINIALDKNNRKAGVGSAVVNSLAATAPDHFVIWDIQQKALGFWKKMGCQFFTDMARYVEQPKGFKGLLVGVIKKVGSETPVADLKGFRKPYKKAEESVEEDWMPGYAKDDQEESEAKAKHGPYPHYTHVDGVEWMDGPGFSLARKGDISLVISKRGEGWHWSIEDGTMDTREQAKARVTAAFKRL